MLDKLLSKLLQKRNIKDISDLDEDEQKTYESWQSTLSKNELTIDDIKAFCLQYVDAIEVRWADYGIDQSKKAELIPYHSFCKTILKVVDSPKAQREALEKNLEQLLKQ